MDERIASIQAQIAQLMDRVAEGRGDHRAILQRLDEMETNRREQNNTNVALQRQADAIDALHEKADMMNEQMQNVACRVTAIEKEPGEQWKKIGFEIIKYIVLAAVGAAIGYLSK